MRIELTPIAMVSNNRLTPIDDHWDDVVSTITLIDPFQASALQGIELFSHVEVIFFFNQVEKDKIESGSRHPRSNPDWPKMGIFAQRGKDRPNRIGTTICRLLIHEGNSITVQGLDALDGTPVLDIKPVMCEFLPQEGVHQPGWVAELMKNYWK